MSAQSVGHDATVTELFSTTPPAEWGGTAAIGGPDEHDIDLATAFREAGEILTAHWQKNQADDTLAIAVLYNYRHALELMLKTAIRLMVESWRFELDPAEPEPAWLVEAERRAGSSHRLGELADHVARLAADFRTPLRPSDWDVLRALHDLDPDGQGLRYTATRDRTRQRAFRPDVVYVNVVEFAARAGGAFDGVEDIVARLVEIQDAQQWIGPERLLPPQGRRT